MLLSRMFAIPGAYAVTVGSWCMLLSRMFAIPGARGMAVVMTVSRAVGVRSSNCNRFRNVLKFWDNFLVGIVRRHIWFDLDVTGGLMFVHRATVSMCGRLRAAADLLLHSFLKIPKAVTRRAASNDLEVVVHVGAVPQKLRLWAKQKQQTACGRNHKPHRHHHKQGRGQGLDVEVHDRKRHRADKQNKVKYLLDMRIA